MIDEKTLNALRKYAQDIYGPDAQAARVYVRYLSDKTVLSMHVKVWDEQALMHPNLSLPFWKEVARVDDTFEECHTLIQEIMAADAYLFKCQVPQEYGIPEVPTDEIDLASGLPVSTLTLTDPQHAPHLAGVLSI